MKVNKYLDNKIGATMFEAAIGVVLLLFSILAGVDLVRLAYTTAIIQYEVVRGSRMANIEANSNRTGFGDPYKKDLTNTCSNSTLYAACGTAATDCTPQLRVCGLRDYIKKNIVVRALSGELNKTGWENNFTIRSVVPGSTTFKVADAGNPGDLLIVDLNIAVDLVSPLKILIGNSVTIRASSVGRNEY